jgi:Asp-tRNA(Asn)/Glu-tRNA(Gln) amidotransferase C subunit
MESLTLETLRHCAGVAGFTWTDEELETIRPALERALAMLHDLETLGLSAVEPATQYRNL